MKYSKLLLSIAIAGLSATGVDARQITVDEAVAKVPEMLPVTTRGGITPVYTQKTASLNVAYVVNRAADNGFVILSADDEMPPVLGYSDSGTFDPNNMPPALAFWLENYGEELQYALSCGKPKVLSKIPQLKTIAPLCKTTWNQDTPFNNNTPSIDGKHTPTGCTATACSQVVNYHKWPEKGRGSHTYTTNTKKFDLTFNFGETTFDWANMKDSYAGGYTKPQSKAVATLMEAIGNLSYMDYDSAASGAWPYNSLYGLVTYMYYDRAGYKADRNYYPIIEWMQLLHSELAAGRPLQYSGSNASAGHAFVVDGYRDGFFHLNWGWGGMSDGYYLITALDPGSQGIGGSAAGYNVAQDALIGLKPAEEKGSELTLIMYASGQLGAYKRTYTLEDNAQIKMNNGSFSGFTLADVNIELGVTVTPEAGGESTFVKACDYNFYACYGTAFPPTFNDIYVPVKDLPREGTYLVTPAFRYKGEVKEARFHVGQPTAVKMECTDTGVSFTRINAQRVLTVDELTLDNDIYVGKSSKLEAVISDQGDEYYGDVYARLYTLDNKKAADLMKKSGDNWINSSVLADVAEDRNDRITLSGTFLNNGKDVEPGDYQLVLVDESGKKMTMLNPMNVSVTAPADGDCSYTFEYKVSDEYEGKGTKDEPYDIGNNFKVSITIKSTAGFFDCNIKYWGVYVNGDGSFNYNGPGIGNSSYNFLVNVGNTQTIEYNLDTSAFTLNKLAAVAPYVSPNSESNIEQKYLSQWIYVKRTTNDVTELPQVNRGMLYPNPAADYATVASDEEIQSVDVYSIAGTRVAHEEGNSDNTMTLSLGGLSAGHYIVLVQTADGVERHRLIKK